MKTAIALGLCLLFAAAEAGYSGVFGPDEVRPEGYMTSGLSLSNSGFLFVQTRVWTDKNWRGFTGGMTVFLLDEHGDAVWKTPLRKIGINGRYIPGAPSDRLVETTAQIPDGAMRLAHSVVVFHRHAPTDRLWHNIDEATKGRLTDIARVIASLEGK